jgi:hypothetical protein
MRNVCMTTRCRRQDLINVVTAERIATDDSSSLGAKAPKIDVCHVQGCPMTITLLPAKADHHALGARVDDARDAKALGSLGEAMVAVGRVREHRLLAGTQ